MDKPTFGWSGNALFEALTGTYDFSPHELPAVYQVCRTVDLIDRLQATVDAAPVIADEVRVLPAVVELRQQRLTLARLLAAMRLPDLDTAIRPQRRQVRGTYSKAVRSA